MARIRTIKPEFWTSEQIVECSPIARLLFVGLWTFADDRGVIPRRSRSIKMLIFPGDDFCLDDIDRWIDELQTNGLVCVFSADGTEYLSITGWEKHQRIDRPSFKYPNPQDFDTFSEPSPRTIDERSTNDRRTPGSGREWIGGEGKGKESTGGDAESTTPVLPTAEAIGATVAEIAETPPDGPAGTVTELDVIGFVQEWNRLAELHPSRLARYGQATLNRFDREAFLNRVAAGTWAEDWQAFVAALEAGRVTSERVTVKKALQGEILDVVAQGERTRRSGGNATPTPSRKRRRPAATPERPYRDMDDDDLAIAIESTADWIARLEATPEPTLEQLEKLTKAHAKLAAIRAESDARRDETETETAAG